MFSIADGREHFWQWDLNRQIVVNDPTIAEVHFCNKTDECSLIVEVEQITIFANGKETIQSTANVPNILLQNDFPIRVYAYCKDGYTKVEKTFKVHTRSKPDDYVYTETEVKRWEDLANRADEALKAVEEIPEALESKVDKSSIVTVPKANAIPQYDIAGILQGNTAKTDNDLVNLGLLNTRLSELKVSEGLEKRVQNLEDMVNPQYYAPETLTEVLNTVPYNVCTYTEIESIGGNSQKEEISNNLCICDGEYDLSTKEYLELDFGELEAGEYYLYIEGNDINICFARLYGGYILPYYTEGITFENPLTFKTQYSGNVSIGFESEYYNGGEGDYYIGGTITGIMLCKASDTDKTYKPRLNKQYLGATKAQEIISYGEKTSNNIYNGTNSVTCNGQELYEFSIGKLPVGDYYISIDTSQGYGLYDFEAYSNNWNNYSEGGGFYSNNTRFYVNDSNTENYLKLKSEYYYFGEEGTSHLNGTFKNIMICNYTDEDKEYKPYQKYGETLDTVVIPVEVQNQKGFGLAVDTINTNRIEFRDDSRIIYVRAFDEITDLSDLPWSAGSNGIFTTSYSYSLNKMGIKKYTNSQTPIAISSKYTIASGTDISNKKVDKAITTYYTSYQLIRVRDTSAADLATFKESIKGEKLIVELEKPEEIDVTDYFNHDSFLKVLSGGKIEVVTDNGASIPVSLTYLFKGGSV